MREVCLGKFSSDMRMDFLDKVKLTFKPRVDHFYSHLKLYICNTAFTTTPEETTTVAATTTTTTEHTIAEPTTTTTAEETTTSVEPTTTFITTTPSA